MPIELRAPHAADLPAIRRLIAQLGYELSPETIQANLAELAERSEPVLLACEGEEVLGLMAIRWGRMLQTPAPLARITTLVVLDAARGRGVGKLLVDAGADLARAAGSEVLELTTGLHRTAAQEFYKAIGFTVSALRLNRPLG
ncbi:N-acetyltransferase family protein [Roseococcus sp. YIM B11640]|uniref:GNAT family N-acetyltransferase n=1 Tax=Roseococcus sp. YIM B11640 TaxID=3133973 RepID=UPI003C7E539D